VQHTSTASVSLNQSSYLVGLDHLRAVAACLVVLYHGGNFHVNWARSRNPFVAMVEEGHTAVTLFMVLSGFLFTLAAEGKRLHYWQFLRNRLLRVYPLCVVLMLVAVAASPQSYNPWSFAQTLFLQANFPGAFKVEPFTNVFWTVSVECQFYIVFPVLLRAYESEGLRWVCACVVGATLLRLAAFMLGAFPEDIIYWHLGGRIDQFLVGMAAAGAYRRLVSRALPFGILSALAAGIVFACVTGFHLAGGWAAAGWWKAAWPTLEALAWAALMVCYVPFARAMPRYVSEPLRLVGTWSYSLYLLHFTVLAAAPRLIPHPVATGPGMHLVVYTATYVLPAAIGVSALSYYAIERPFMALRVRYLSDRPMQAVRGAERS
jgi:peptidoglycan/LPS O-acetylase OafA/YrhL